MSEDRDVPERVKLRLKFKPIAELPATEQLWGEPVDAHEGGGTYRLLNSSFVVPLAAGDVVWAEPAGDGVLQVTGVATPSGSILTMIGGPPGAELDFEPVVERWSQGGALWTEGRGGLLVTIWSDQMRLEAIESVVRPTLAEGLVWLATALPVTRVAENMPEADFELERVVIEPVDEESDQG